LENAPETEYNLSVEYKLPIVSMGIFSIRGDFIHKDDCYFDPQNGPDFLMKGYDLVNGRIGYENHDGTIGIYFWGKNLTDELYMLTRAIAPTNIRYAWFGPPRTFGIQVTYSFGEH